MVEVQREDHGEARRGVAVLRAHAAEGPEDGEHGVHALHWRETTRISLRLWVAPVEPRR